MKIVNNQLEEIDDKAVEATMIEINNLTLAFLNNAYNYVGQKYRLEEKIDGLIIEILSSTKEKYTTLYNGEKHQRNVPGYVGAFVTKITQEFQDKKWHFKNGIVFPFQFGKTSLKKKIHEYLHFLSGSTLIENVDGKYHDKVGLRFTTYDEFDNVVDKTFSCSFLNEGMTEFLASRITNTYPDAYELNVMVIELLTMNSHNELVEAYFSSDFREIIKYQELFENVSGCSFDTIFNNNQFGINIPKEKTEEIILACIKYQVNSALTAQELDEVEYHIISIIQKYNKSLNIVIDGESIVNKLNDIINAKKQIMVNKNK